MAFPIGLAAPTTRPDVVRSLRDDGFVVLSPEATLATTGAVRAELDALVSSWDDLPADAHLLDGGAYRFRRHGCFVYEPGTGALSLAEHRAHYQPVTYNALHGGLLRWFSPLAEAVSSSRGLASLVGSLGQLFAELQPVQRWFVEAHAFRIDPREGVGRPTPEGAHRDGVDFVAVILVDRVGVKGGETRVFEANGPRGVRFSLGAPWAALLLDDARVVHETTPIVLAEPGAHRDTLVLTFRAAGFQAPDVDHG